MRTSYLIAGLALAAAVIIGLTYYLNQADSRADLTENTGEPEGAPQVASQPAGSETTLEMMGQTPPSPGFEDPQERLPSLDESDVFVRERLPEALPDNWLQKDDLVRRVAVVLENANRGEIPKRQLAFLAPEGRFAVSEVDMGDGEDARRYIDPQSYARYDRYLELLEALPAEELAALLADTEPLLNEAMTELGVQEEAVPQLQATIEQILSVPVLRGDVELSQPKVLFEYADPELEALSDLQKQVLRMGPDNVERLKAYLKDLRAALNRP